MYLNVFLVELKEQLLENKSLFAIIPNALDFRVILCYHVSNKYLLHAKDEVLYI